jgi:hypothetical protein
MREDEPMTAEYLASPQIRLVQQKAVGDASGAVQYEERLVRYHAVASFDGISAAVSVCTRFRANIEELPRSFHAVRPLEWCDECAARLKLTEVA